MIAHAPERSFFWAEPPRHEAMLSAHLSIWLPPMEKDPSSD
jgi:hypothetical protein